MKHGRSVSELGWTSGETRYQTMPWYLPLMYAGIGHAIVWAAVLVFVVLAGGQRPFGL